MTCILNVLCVYPYPFNACLLLHTPSFPFTPPSTARFAAVAFVGVRRAARCRSVSTRPAGRLRRVRRPHAAPGKGWCWGRCLADAVGWVGAAVWLWRGGSVCAGVACRLLAALAWVGLLRFCLAVAQRPCTLLTPRCARGEGATTFNALGCIPSAV